VNGRRTGASGGATRVVIVRGLETGEDPIEFVAVTAMVYAVLARSPVNVADFVAVEFGVTVAPFTV